MHSGKHYSFIEVITWTRRDIYMLLVISFIPAFLYEVLGWKWISIPWLPIALLGTAVAFVVSFKNNASYDRMWEARRAWGSILNASRSWGIMVKDFVTNHQAAGQLPDAELEQVKLQLINRHVAWLTALRYQLREPRVWEAIYETHNQEYQKKWFHVAEHKGDLKEQLLKYLSADEVEALMKKSNKAAQLISKQSDYLRTLFEKGLLENFKHAELQKLLVEFYNQQGVSERIKNFPYPRQYATLNLYFIRIFVVLVPLGMLQEFNKMGEHLVWLSIPFSALSTWIFTTMEKIGESTESPFEGSANDVPITAISRTIEIDLKEMFNYKDIPAPLKAENNILL